MFDLPGVRRLHTQGVINDARSFDEMIMTIGFASQPFFCLCLRGIHSIQRELLHSTVFERYQMWWDFQEGTVVLLLSAPHNKPTK